MFGPASADVYGKLPLEDGIVDVGYAINWGFLDSASVQSSISVEPDFHVDMGEDDDG